MIHLIWYIVVGLIAGIIAKSVMHVHMTIFWTIVLGIIGSIIGCAVTHMFSHPTTALRISYVLWNLCLVCAALTMTFTLRLRQSFDLLQDLFGSHLNF